MDLNEFRNCTKVELNESLVRSVVDAFLLSNLPFYNENNSLMACMELNPDNSGRVSEEVHDEFVNELMLNMCYDFSSGKESYMALDEENRVKMAQVFYNRIREQVFKKSTVVYDATGVNISGDIKNLEHEFVFNVPPENFVQAVQYLYRNIREKALRGFRIVTPATRFICAGYNTPIKLKCSSEELNKMIDFLNDIREDFVEFIDVNYNPLVSTVPEIYDIAYVSWFGYTQVLDGKTSASRLCNAIYDALCNVIIGYIHNNDYVIDKRKKAEDFYNEFGNKYVAIRKIFQDICLNKNLEYISIVTSIFEETLNNFERFSIDKNDILRFAEINEKVEEFFGKVEFLEDDSNTLFEEGEGVIETPVSIISNFELVSPEEVKDLTEEDYLKAEELFRQAMVELESQIRSNALFLEECKENDDFESVITSLFKKIENHESLVNDYEIMTNNNISPDELADYNELIEQYYDMLYVEKHYEDGIIWWYLNDYLKREKALEEEEIKTPEEKEKTDDKFKALDSAIAFIERMEEEEEEERQRKAREEAELNAFAPQNQSENESEISTDVSKRKEESQPYRLVEGDYSLDYRTKDGILIPDFRAIAYDGNNLGEALKTWGYSLDDGTPKDIAAHFGFTDYTGTEEQDKAIIEILKNLSEYDMYGYKLGENKETVASTNLVETEKQEDSPSQEEGDLYNIPVITDYRAAAKLTYSFYVSDPDYLDYHVKGTNYTVLDYFKYFNLKERIKYDDKLVTHDDSKVITGREFADGLVAYLVNWGPDTLDNIIASSIQEIKVKNTANVPSNKGR